jgi:hypothetical protein
LYGWDVFKDKGEMVMDNAAIVNFMTTNMFYIVGILGILVIIMYVIIINLFMNLTYMKKRYKKMMAGVDGGNMERMLMGHIDEVKAVIEENKKLKEENKRIDALLKKSLTRVGIIRFRAFDNMGSDLSYAAALLNSSNDGLIFSSIFGREESRSYVKPIRDGKSTYTLTEEEESALHDAMQQH